MNTPFRGSIGGEAARARELQNLRLVVLLHHVAGAMLALFSCLFAVPIWLAVRATSPVAPAIVWMASVALVIGWTMACVLVHAGRSIERRRRLRWCQVVAALSTLWLPFGTALGIFTLVVLGKPYVRAQFGEDLAAPLPLPPTPFVDDAAWAGWVSADAKRHFTRQAVLFSVPLLLIQFALPIVHFARAFSRAMRGSAFAETGSAVRYADRVWFIERTFTLGGTSSARLANVSTDDDGSPVAGPDIQSGSRFLAPDGPRLWVVGEKTLACYEAGHVTTAPAADAPRWPSRPFDYGGHPAFFDWNRNADEIHMVSLENGHWVPGSSWEAPAVRFPSTWVVLPIDAGFDVFMLFGRELRWRHIGAENGIGNPEAWELVSSSVSRWAAFRLGEESVVVLPIRDGVFDRHLSQLHRTEAGWVVTGEFDEPAATSFGVISSGSASMDLVLSGPGEVRTLALSPGKVPTRHVHMWPGAAPFDLRLTIGLTIFGFIPGLFAAVLLGRLMRRDRAGVLEGERPRPFASLPRRGFASGIDHVPLAIVTAAMWWHTLRSPPNNGKVDVWLEWLAVWLAVWLGTLLVTSYMEGRWGVTPGKWLLDIRVIDIGSGKACGFWRALLRKALQVIDGALGFFVGIFTVAFTRNWQRVGDLAAKTVVVQKSS